MEFSDRCERKRVVAAPFSTEKIYMMCQHMAKCEERTPAYIKNIYIHSTKQFAVKELLLQYLLNPQSL